MQRNRIAVRSQSSPWVLTDCPKGSPNVRSISPKTRKRYPRILLVTQAAVRGGCRFGADHQKWVLLPKLIYHPHEDITPELIRIRRYIQQKQDRVCIVGLSHLGGHFASKKAWLPNPTGRLSGLVGKRFVVYVKGPTAARRLKNIPLRFGETEVCRRCGVKHVPIG